MKESQTCESQVKSSLEVKNLLQAQSPWSAATPPHSVSKVAPLPSVNKSTGKWDLVLNNANVRGRALVLLSGPSLGMQPGQPMSSHTWHTL